MPKLPTIEKIVLVGLIPDPQRAQNQRINNCLEPIVDELIQPYHGVRIPTFEFPAAEVFCAELIMVSCDNPASRKSSGFTAHNSTCVCFKCNRHFTPLDSTNKIDFHGFKKSEWVHRSCGKNRLHGEELNNTVTLSERKHL
ncbi:hypothetical protein PHYBLDRAFT_63052 [Phycomyces blakesleeanus NRRL 1555(-)]|uniref:Uncharacterized protein n=1 Tax=Phycomyces blakesleeanus (strain ATCC 8743b / DSM 1359 / FGSC 10004 / NBRC 33097 / NRRL 1555) TaxID=763407 RepID=A0A162XVU8_PHYB8|nr:hypothetical protein PHYBLDRAFT_63052 [Phycomyces blakesleeanus NRRL 1555(-)]OAD76745.1 hypothetical protein PHYBLDRAFT_63052 [Phycomyces blakesleeanus NRRL 1555(-)]|eukprot:XP_018294785.1 hypothetical protein PHYBLDRAFT_63052 [Phycomyces blakesleeanus NRRL 1555(-)]